MSESNYTIGEAAKDYLIWFKLHRKSFDRTQYLIDAHILPNLGRINIFELQTIQIREWQDALVTTPRRKRTKKNKPQKYLDKNDNENYFRQRKATANRILNVLKAILNKAYYDGIVDDDKSWQRVKPFRKVDKPRTEYLDLLEIKSLVSAANKELKNLIRGALYTGCRYGELTKLRKRDLNMDIMKLYVEPSKSGTARYVVLNKEGSLFFNDICADKEPDDYVFTRQDGRKWGRSHQQRPLKKALVDADINKSVSFHTLRHTHASQLAMKGVPMPVIARQLGHADTRVTERHYAHMAPDYVADIIRANFPDMGIN